MPGGKEALELSLQLPESERVLLALQLWDAASVAGEAALGEEAWTEAWALEIERRVTEVYEAGDLGADEDLLCVLGWDRAPEYESG